MKIIQEIINAVTVIPVNIKSIKHHIKLRRFNENCVKFIGIPINSYEFQSFTIGPPIRASAKAVALRLRQNSVTPASSRRT